MTKLPCVLSFIALAACAHDTTAYPSLAPRPIEQLGFAEPDTPVAPPVAADPALDARIAAIATRLAAITRGFDTAIARARAAARAPGAHRVGSDSWLDAQSALAGLDDWRTQASGLAAETADLASARAQALAADYPALTSIQTAVDTQAARQESEVARIQASVPAA